MTSSPSGQTSAPTLFPSLSRNRATTFFYSSRQFSYRFGSGEPSWRNQDGLAFSRDDQLSRCRSRGRPPLRWKDGLARRLCIVQPTTSSRKERDEAPGSRHPGAMCSKDWVGILEAPETVKGASIGVAYHSVPTEGATQVMVETVGAGARKSGCFWLMLWSVGCHQHLRSVGHTVHPPRNWLSALTLIAYNPETSDSEDGMRNAVLQAIRH